jgi:hypothetical protein
MKAPALPASNLVAVGNLEAATILVRRGAAKTPAEPVMMVGGGCRR